MFYAPDQELIFSAEGFSNEGYRFALSLKLLFRNPPMARWKRNAEPDREARIITRLKSRLVEEAGRLSYLEIVRNRESVCRAALKGADGERAALSETGREIFRRYGVHITGLFIESVSLDTTIQQRLEQAATERLLARQQFQLATDEKNARRTLMERILTLDIPGATFDQKLRAYVVFCIHEALRVGTVDKKLHVTHLDVELPELDALANVFAGKMRTIGPG